MGSNCRHIFATVKFRPTICGDGPNIASEGHLMDIHLLVETVEQLNQGAPVDLRRMLAVEGTLSLTVAGGQSLSARMVGRRPRVWVDGRTARLARADMVRLRRALPGAYLHVAVARQRANDRTGNVRLAHV